MADGERGEERECVQWQKVTGLGVSRRPSPMTGELRVRACERVKEVTCVPEIWCRGPLQSEAGQVHSSIHQQEENGHNAGDGVELPWEQHQLERKKNKSGEEGEQKKEEEKREQKKKVGQNRALMPLWPFPANYFSQPKTIRLKDEPDNVIWMFICLSVKKVIKNLLRLACFPPQNMFFFTP